MALGNTESKLAYYQSYSQKRSYNNTVEKKIGSYGTSGITSGFLSASSRGQIVYGRTNAGPTVAIPNVEFTVPGLSKALNLAALSTNLFTANRLGKSIQSSIRR